MHWKLLGVLGLVGALASTAWAGILGTDYNNIEYLCCDWGPALTLPSKTNEVAQFNDTEDEVYFLKQVGSFTRKPALLGGDIGHGISIYLCKMRADGSDKTEIKKLWENPNYPIDTQAQTTWMDVNRKTRKIALSITYAGDELTGLWTVNLDGSELKRLISPTWINGYLQRIDSPSWTPDGEWIVYREETNGKHLMKCDKNGQHNTRYPLDTEAMQPRVSPDGKLVVFRFFSPTKGGFWIMNIDGGDAHPLPNPANKRTGRHDGSYAAWSPDGKRILSSGRIIDCMNGRILVDREPHYKGKPYTYGWPHWGKGGIIGSCVGGILLTDSELREARWLAGSGLTKCSSNKIDSNQW